MADAQFSELISICACGLVVLNKGAASLSATWTLAAVTFLGPYPRSPGGEAQNLHIP